MSYDLGTAHGTIELEYNGGTASRRAQDDIDEIGDEAEQAERKVKRLDRSLSGLGGVLSTVGKGGGFLLIGAGIAQAAVSAANLGLQILATVKELAPLASLAAGIPGALAGAASAAIVLAAAFHGVGDAVKAAFEGDPAKFQEAIKGLAPEAQKAAIAFQQLVKPIQDVQQTLQNTVFSGLAPQITTAVNALLPLKASLNGIAEEFNHAAQTGLQFAATPQVFQFLQGSIDTTRGILAQLNGVLGGVLTGLLQVGQVGLSAFDGLGSTLAGVAQRFGAWMSQIASSGQLAAWIDQAKTVLSQLLNIIGNLGTIFGAAISAASSSASGFIGILNTVTTQLAAFFSSAQGSEALRNIFGAIAQVAGQLAPVLTTLVGIIGGQLGPVLANVALAVGPALLAVVQALGPGIAALTPGLNALATALGAGIAALAPALAPLGAALGALVTAIAPILPIVGQLAATLISALAPIIVALAPAVQALATALTAAFVPILPIITQLGGVIASLLGPAVLLLVTAFTNLLPPMITFGAQLIGALLPAIQALIPAFLAIIQALLPLVTAFLPLSPIIAQLAVALAPLVVAVAQLVAQVLVLIAPLIQLAATFIQLLVANGIAPMLQAIVGGLNAVVGAVVTVIGWITTLIGWLTNLGAIGDSINAGLTAAWNAIVSGVTTAFNAVVSFISQLPGRILAFLSALPGMLASLFTTALNAAATAVGFGLGVIYQLVTGAPGRITNFLNSLPGIIGNIFRNAFNAAVNAVTSGLATVYNFMSQVGNRINSFLSSIPGMVGNVFRSAMSAGASAVSNGVSSILAGFRSIPGAISSLAGAMASAGAAMIHGAINGVLSAVGGLVQAAKDAAARAVAGFKSALGISSPSRVMAVQVGAPVVQGIIVGIDDTKRELQRALDGLAANTIVGGLSANLAGVSSLAAPFLSQGGAVTPATVSGPTVNITQNIEPVPTMDAQQYADYAARKVLTALSYGGAKVPIPSPVPGA